jgi:hypothetical protein
VQVSKEGIERIKASNDLAAVVAERGIQAKRKGRVVVARCPFHEETTASFTITPSKGLFHCFGCGAAGDVIGFVTKYDKLSFRAALEVLARRASLDLEQLMQERPRVLQRTPVEALTPPRGLQLTAEGAPLKGAPPAAVLARVVEHYHRTFCQRSDAREYLERRGLSDGELQRAYKVGYADGSLLKTIPRSGELREQLEQLGVITPEGRELLGGCIVVPIPDPLSGQWVNLYGRGLRTSRHCYLPGPLRGVLNFQAARLSEEVILTESILDALSFKQAGIATAIPLYGTNGFTPDHLDTLKREGVRRVILALDNDEAGRRATEALKEKLTGLGIAVGVVSFPAGIKDANDFLVARNGDAQEVFRSLLAAGWPKPDISAAIVAGATTSLLDQDLVAEADTRISTPQSGPVSTRAGELVLTRGERSYRARVYPVVLGRLRATVKVEGPGGFHVDTLDLYASRSRSEFARRAAKALAVEASAVEADLLVLLVDAEKAGEGEGGLDEIAAPAMTDEERAEALALLRRSDLLEQVSRDIDTLGYVGEETNKRLLYLVAVSRKLDDPLSALILSQSGAGKSGLTEVIEKLCPPEDVVLLTRLTPQSLYYTEPGFLDRKLVIVEERYGSIEADYSIRVLQSRKKLIAAAPIKDPQTGNMRTKVFTVEARAAFIEATTASSVNHENATRCFELAMDESAEQTRRIHERQRLLRTEAGLRLRQEAEALCRRHWNAQRLLQPLPVVIPYADRLSFPSAWMRTRRDHARFLNLIEVSAFLHQHQRERRAGAIVASLDDYAVAYALAGEVLRDTLGDLKKPLREAYARIQALSLKGEEALTRRAIREALEVPDSTVRGWLSELVELEYLEAEASRGGAGKTTRYRLTSRGPGSDLVLGLLAPGELAERLQKTCERAENPRRPLAGFIS